LAEEKVMNKQLKVLILTTKLPEDIWLINKLAEVCRIEGIVLPVGRRWKDFGVVNVLRKRIRQYGILSVINQAILILYRLVFETYRDKKSFEIIFNEKPYDHIENNNVDILEVVDINSNEVENFIREKSPEVIVVSGTPILKKIIFNSAKGRIINLHPGLAPQYRGRYGAFWPIYNQEPQLVGTTIHFIDEGIDTGAILIQNVVIVEKSDTIKAITYKQQKLGVDLIIQCLTRFEVLSDRAYHKEGCESRNYHIPGITHYLKAKKWMRQINYNKNRGNENGI
jgi:folate-dependent phosphoribosylglycinamide formyltransferase PurN